jgi:hypothetical protein
MYAVLISVLLQINQTNPPDPAAIRRAQEAQDRIVQQMFIRRMEEQKYRPPLSVQEEWAAKEAVVQERVFIGRFNNLLKKLRVFIDGYNSGKVDVKTVHELQKAWNQMQKEGWFKNASRAHTRPDQETREDSAVSSCKVEQAETESDKLQ